MLKVRDLSSKFSKTNVRFEISTFEIECEQNFVKIRKLILFDPKCPYLVVRAQNSRTNVRYEISTFEIGYMPNFLKMRELILFGPKCPNLSIWARNFQKPTSDLVYRQNGNSV